MTLQSELVDYLHGVPIGASSLEVYCDCIHDIPAAIDTDARVQYECIRIGEAMEIFEAFPIFDVWAPDLLRCPECERASLEEPTDGYGEALVELDIARSNGRYLLDASDLTLLDHSPVDEGVEPPAFPKSVFETICEQKDWGALRRSRYTTMVDRAREKGNHEVANNLARGL